MNMTDMPAEGRELITAEGGTVALLNRSEIDMQIATAHKFPRSIKQFRTDVLDMVTLSESIAQECIYALPRDGKVIEGPSARFAEVIANSWGNSRAGARVVSDAGEFVTAQGVFHDLQKNVAITYEVQRRITDKHGRRYKPDMIGVTANAACSIALRNAILKGVPKAYWADMYDAARKTAMGDIKTLPNRRAEAFKAFVGYGIAKDQVLAKLGLQGEEDIGQDELVILRGILTAIRDGDTTPEQAFAPEGEDKPKAAMPQRKSERTAGEEAAERPATAATAEPMSSIAQGAISGGSQGPLPVPPPSVPGEMASAGEIGLLQGKARAIKIPMSAVLQDCGITGVDPETLAGLTKEQFRLAKAKL